MLCQDSTVGIVTCYGHGRSGDRIPVGARFSTPVQTGPGTYPVSYTVGTGSVQGVKWPGRGIDHPWAFVACYLYANMILVLDSGTETPPFWKAITGEWLLYYIFNKYYGFQWHMTSFFLMYWTWFEKLTSIIWTQTGLQDLYTISMSTHIARLKNRKVQKHETVYREGIR
jgi:hypothetical protein